jgi:6-phosphogluconolactonase/glucosamine-6-phosphate isomerase/deaminase
MAAGEQSAVSKRVSGDKVWIGDLGPRSSFTFECHPFKFEVLDTEEAVGQAMYDELVDYAGKKEGDVSIVLLGGRGAQAMYKVIRAKARTNEIDDLLGRLNVFTQDALAPMKMDNGLSFVRDFERLLGPEFFAKVKSFTPMFTDTPDLENELVKYLEKLEAAGGIDIFFMGFGPEAEAASHLCYIKPGSGAKFDDVAGIIPISESILEHHVSKFKVGGSNISAEDEQECRSATHILTLGPAAILGAKRIVQSIVDASTAPAKRPSFKRFIETEISSDPEIASAQMDENPGLWIRLRKNVRSLVLPDLLTKNT